MLKVNLLILPFVILCFCFLQFDRTNIGNALTDTLSRDINITNTDVNLAQTLFTVGFIITEIPFNVISSYIGPERFLPITMFLWGVATWCQMFLTNSTGLLVTRFFIGALEGGYIPGFALYLAGYYTNAELASVYAMFWASNAIAGALGGPLSIGLLSLAGHHGLAGWQWLFLIGTCWLTLLHTFKHTCVKYHVLTNLAEGSLTCFLAVVAYIYLPHTAANPKTFFGRRIALFSRSDASIIIARVIRDDPTKAHRFKKRVTLSHIWETFADWRLYGHLVGGCLSMVMISPMNTYAPSIIKSLGFTKLQANGLNSVGSVCSLVASISLAVSSDRFQERGIHTAVGYLLSAAGLLWLALAPADVHKWTLYGMDTSSSCCQSRTRTKDCSYR